MFDEKSKADSLATITGRINIRNPKQADSITYFGQEVENPIGEIFAQNGLLVVRAIVLTMRDEFQLVLMIE